MGVLIDEQVAEVQRRCVDMQLREIGPGATQYRLDARRDLAQGERLDDVVVGTELQAGDAFGFETSPGEEDHRHVADQSKLAQDVTAVFGAEDDVQQDEVRFH
jgi:hypothetical protein